jgi:hypothetical protein
MSTVHNYCGITLHRQIQEKILSLMGRAELKIVISLLVTVIRYSLPLLVSNDHVLESTNNSVMSNKLVLYI